MMTRTMKMKKLLIIVADDDNGDGGGDHFVTDAKGTLTSSLPSTRWPAIVNKHSEATNNIKANTP